MNPGKSKKIRKQLAATGLTGDDLINAYKTAKKQKAIDWLKANIPKAPAVLFKKKRPNESIDGFRERRRKANDRKRKRRMGGLIDV